MQRIYRTVLKPDDELSIAEVRADERADLGCLRMS